MFLNRYSLYLYKLKQKGIVKKGRLEVFEKKKGERKRYEVVLDGESKEKLLKILEDIENIIKSPTPPKPVFENKCKKCAYYEYCFI